MPSLLTLVGVPLVRIGRGEILRHAHVSGTELLNELVRLRRVEARVNRFQPAGQPDEVDKRQVGRGRAEPDRALKHKLDAESLGVPDVVG
jgi:hypothetical protein